jgi:outer membrane receptor protein involved in Fe transport
LPVFVPAEHRDNPTGDRLRWYGRVGGSNSPPYETEYDSDTLHTVAGIGGDFGGISESAEEWEWELAGTWSGNRYQVFAQDVLTANLQDALNSCGPTDDPAGCWNPFSFGTPNSQQLIDRVHGELRTKADTSLTTVSADLTGPLFELPGGDLSVAVGGQLRMETAESNADHDSNQEAFVFLVGGPDWQSDRRILAAYGELLLPFFSGFELQAAGRVESYDDVGTSANPMLGVSWTPATTFAGAEASPVSKVRLRGTYSTAFRAPSLLQGNGAITELSEIFNVTNNAGAPERSPLGVYTAVRTFGSDDLTPQKSTTITGGLEWAPTPSLLIEGDYWRYSYKDIIVKENAQAKVTADFATMSDPDITRDPVAGIPTRINVRFVNAQEVLTHGIDLGATFRSDFGAQAGTFSAGANASYVLAYEIPQSSVPSPLWNESFASCDQPSALPGAARAGSSCDAAGLRNISTFARSLPRLRASMPLGWNLDGHNAAIIANLIGSYRDDGDSDPTAGEDYRAIDAQVTFDLQYAYRWQADEHLATTFKLGVVNALDTDPPAVNAGYGYDVSTHDPRGRLIYGRLIQEF